MLGIGMVWFFVVLKYVLFVMCVLLFVVGVMVEMIYDVLFVEW